MTGAGELLRFEAAVVTSANPQAVLDVLCDIPSHLEWAGRRSTMKHFRLLEVDGPAGSATVGTRFTSTGANDNGTFYDSSVVTEAEPYRFAFETTSRLDRKHGREWQAHFSHRYDIKPDEDGGARIVYTCRVHDGNYVPYWLKPGIRRVTRLLVGKMIERQLRNLAQLAQERAGRHAGV